jgi:hypothetical protein
VIRVQASRALTARQIGVGMLWPPGSLALLNKDQMVRSRLCPSLVGVVGMAKGSEPPLAIPGWPTPKGPDQFNAHSPGGGGSGFSPTRFTLTGAEASSGALATRPVRRAAKRKTLYVMTSHELVCLSAFSARMRPHTDPRLYAAGSPVPYVLISRSACFHTSCASGVMRLRI